MSIDETPTQVLYERLMAVESKEATQRLMALLAYKQGVAQDELPAWFGFDAETIDEWFEEFELKSIEEVITEIERFELPGRSVKPIVRQPGLSRVSFLNYDVMDDFGWRIDDEDLFNKAADADLDHEDYGRVAVERGESILEAVERRGYEWPFACRGGACSNCAVLLKEGEIAMPGQQILPEDAIDRGARLTCVGVPATETVKLVYNAKHVDYLDELLLPPTRFIQSHSA